MMLDRLTNIANPDQTPLSDSALIVWSSLYSNYKF